MTEQECFLTVADRPDRSAYRHLVLNTRLLQAVYEQDSDAHRLLEEGASADATCRQNGVCACQLAGLFGLEGVLEKLLERGASPCRPDRAGLQPAHYAAHAGHTSVLRLLHRRGATLTAPVSPGRRVLINDDADSLSHDHQSLDDLLGGGIIEGSTPLHQACRRVNLECVEFLTSCMTKEEINTRDAEGQTALDVVATSPQSEEGLADRTMKIVQCLLEAGATFPRCELSARQVPVTALHTAVSRNDRELIRFLLDKGAQLDIVNEEGDSAVHLAVKEKLIGPLEVMIASDSRAVEVRDLDGVTPLHVAVGNQWNQGVSLLLSSGADVIHTSEDSQTVLHLAASNGNVSMLEDLLSIPETMQILETKDSDGYTPLSCAVCQNQVNCVEVLRWDGANMKCRIDRSIDDQMTLLHLAAMNNAADVIEYFLSFDDLPAEVHDPKLRSGKKKSTALHLAANKGHLRTVECLLKNDKQLLMIKDGTGMYPLHVAAMNGHREVVKYMIQNGADLSASISAKIDGSAKKIKATALDIIAYCIPEPVEFLLDIFDSYVTMNGHLDDASCEIAIKCDILVPSINNDNKQMDVLKAIVKSRNEELENELLLHPVVETFLHLKWDNMKILFYTQMFFYAMLTVIFTALSLVTNLTEHNMTTHYFCYIGYMVMVFVYFIIILTEAMFSYPADLFYRLSDYEFWNKLIVFVGIIVASFVESGWERYITSVTILFSWTLILFMVARMPSFGYYVLMFTKVTTKICKVLGTFLFLFLGFYFALIVLFNASSEFSTSWLGLEAFMKVFMMMTELNYEDTFDAGDSSAFAFCGRIIFVFFNFTIVLVLTNLMVGLAVSDVGQLEAQGMAQQLAKQIVTLASLEFFLYNVCLERVLRILPACILTAMRRMRHTKTRVNSSMNSLPTSIFPQLPDSVRVAVLEIVLHKRANRTRKVSVIG